MRKARLIGFIAGNCFLISLFAVQVFAQEEEGEEEYESTLDTGLRIHDDGKGGSAISRAARLGASIVLMEQEEAPAVSAPESEVHTVVAGDTLWALCTRFFDDPYVWPRIWSYNPKITNPNWIYPGDVIWLVPPTTPVTVQIDQETGAPVTVDTTGEVTTHLPPAILVRNRGFVDKELLAQAGTIVGANKINMLLVEFDEAYAEFETNTEVRQGDEFAAYTILGPVGGIDDPGTEVGKLVEILGQVRVARFDAETRIARVVIDESLMPIERGTQIGPVHRRFDFVPTVVNSKDIEGRIIAFLDPIVIAAQHHIVFVDRGSRDGVREGNRFFVVEKRDNYMASLNLPDAREGYPKEIVAELRVVEARPHTSTCLVTGGIREIAVGDNVEMRRGY